MKLGCLLSRGHRKAGLVDLLRVTNPSSAVNSTTTLDFRASGLSDSGLVFTCCKLGCENNLEKLQKAGFPHMQTQGCTCLPSGTSPHAGAGESQPVSVTMHSGTPPADLGARRRRIPGGASGGRSDPDQEAGSVRLAIIRGSKQTQPLMQKFVRIVTRRTRKRWRTTAAALHLKRKMNSKWRVL